VTARLPNDARVPPGVIAALAGREATTVTDAVEEPADIAAVEAEGVTGELPPERRRAT
jgi:hypothetical protein